MPRGLGLQAFLRQLLSWCWLEPLSHKLKWRPLANSNPSAGDFAQGAYRPGAPRGSIHLPSGCDSVAVTAVSAGPKQVLLCKDFRLCSSSTSTAAGTVGLHSLYCCLAMPGCVASVVGRASVSTSSQSRLLRIFELLSAITRVCLSDGLRGLSS